MRVAYPVNGLDRVLSRVDYGPGSGHRPDIGISGVDGRGVTIALLDTGVDAAVPYLRGRVLDGHRRRSAARPARSRRPARTTRRSSSATAREMAGLLVGAGGPSGLSGVATGAAVLPIRVAGWQPDALGHCAIYARSDQIIAGLERAVDPNDDGDAHDAARIALIALAEPFAGFTDGPEARAVAGALALDTLVVAPAGQRRRGGAGLRRHRRPGRRTRRAHRRRARRAHAPGAARIVVRAGLDDAARRHDAARRRRRAGAAARPDTSPFRAGRSAARGARRRG